MIPSVPITLTTLVIGPARGTLAVGSSTSVAKAGMAMPAAAIRSMSEAVETDCGWNPLASTKWVWSAPSDASRAFILATNAASLPASHLASV